MRLVYKYISSGMFGTSIERAMVIKNVDKIIDNTHSDTIDIVLNNGKIYQLYKPDVTHYELVEEENDNG